MNADNQPIPNIRTPISNNYHERFKGRHATVDRLSWLLFYCFYTIVLPLF